MRIIRDVTTTPAEWKHTVLALGNFDGMHKGHTTLISECVALAKKLGTKPAVLTFEPHPREFFSPEKKPVSIYTFRQKVEHLGRMGIECIFALRFDNKLAATSAHDFIHQILGQSLSIKHVLTGYNFAFGKGRAGNTDFLKQEAQTLGFGVSIMPAVQDKDETISTSAIRAALAKGDIQKASHLLGHAYFLEGHVCHGHKRGQSIGFPTANLRMHHLCPPRFGVYAVRILVDGAWHDGIANIGVRPTFGQNAPVLEVHIFDVNKDIYGKRIRVEFIEFIRGEQTFTGIDALRLQIASDIAQVRQRKVSA